MTTHTARSGQRAVLPTYLLSDHCTCSWSVVRPWRANIRHQVYRH